MIFISYSNNDSNFVLKLANRLRDSRYDVWLDQLDIKPSDPWDEAIQNALDRADNIIVVLSNASVTSSNVKDEVSYALDLGKKVTPVLLERCNVPFRWRRKHYADFSKSFEQGYERLSKSLPSPKPPKPPKPPDPTPPPRWPIKKYVLLVFGIVFLIYISGAVLKECKKQGPIPQAQLKIATTDVLVNFEIKQSMIGLPQSLSPPMTK